MKRTAIPGALVLSAPSWPAPCGPRARGRPRPASRRSRHSTTSSIRGVIRRSMQATAEAAAGWPSASQTQHGREGGGGLARFLVPDDPQRHGTGARGASRREVPGPGPEGGLPRGRGRSQGLQAVAQGTGDQHADRLARPRRNATTGNFMMSPNQASPILGPNGSVSAPPKSCNVLACAQTMLGRASMKTPDVVRSFVKMGMFPPRDGLANAFVKDVGHHVAVHGVPHPDPVPVLPCWPSQTITAGERGSLNRFASTWHREWRSKRPRTHLNASDCLK